MTRGGNTPEVRRAHLKEYILACLRDNIFSWQDIVNGNAVDVLLKAVPGDVRAVVRDLGKQGLGGLAQLGGLLLNQLGQKLVEKK